MISQDSDANSSTHDADSHVSSDEIVMYTTAWCFDCRRAKRIFASAGVPYREVDIARHPDAAEIVRRINSGNQSVPTIIFPDGSVLVEPSTRELEAKLRQRQS